MPEHVLLRKLLGRIPHAADETLLALAHEKRRALIAEDKNFGGLVFLRRPPHPHIVWLAVDLRVAGRGDAMREGTITMAIKSRMRIRPADPGGQNDG